MQTWMPPTHRLFVVTTIQIFSFLFSSFAALNINHCYSSLVFPANPPNLTPTFVFMSIQVHSNFQCMRGPLTSQSTRPIKGILLLCWHIPCKNWQMVDKISISVMIWYVHWDWVMYENVVFLLTINAWDRFWFLKFPFR